MLATLLVHGTFQIIENVKHEIHHLLFYSKKNEKNKSTKKNQPKVVIIKLLIELNNMRAKKESLSHFIFKQIHIHRNGYLFPVFYSVLF